jgi:GNAT superfamily N-acetyltransferase
VDDLLIRWIAELRSEAPRAAVVASLETAAHRNGYDLPAAFQALTAARSFNPDLHPRGKDGKFIEKLGFVKLSGMFEAPNGKRFNLEGARGQVRSIDPDPATPGKPNVTVDLHKNGKPVGTLTVKPHQIEAAPEKARLDMKLPSKQKPSFSQQFDDRVAAKAAPAEANPLAALSDDEIIERLVDDPDDMAVVTEYNRRFTPGGASQPVKADSKAQQIARQIEATHRGVTIEMSEPAPGIWRISAIKVAPEARGGGLGGKALDDLLARADDEQVAVSLTPEQFGGAGGMSDSQLRAWYGRRGFVPNSGPARMQETSDSMVRPPETEEARTLRLERRKAGQAVTQMPDEALDDMALDPTTNVTWQQAIAAEKANRAKRRAEADKRRGQVIKGINEQAKNLSTTDPQARAKGLDKILSKLRFSPIDTDKVHDDVYPPGQSGRYTAERHAQHEAIWADMLATLEASDIPKDRDALLVGGLPGAGKSSMLKPGGAAEQFGVVAWEPTGPVPAGATHVVVNPDLFKDMMIQRGMLPQGISQDIKPNEQVTFIHGESNYIGKMITNRLAAAGYNVILDNTMQSSSDAERRATPLAQTGYKFRGLFADIPVDESRASVEKRYLADALTEMGGRFVSSAVAGSSGRYSNKSYSKNRDAMDDLVERDWFTEWMIVDNTGIGQGAPKGEIVGEGTGGGTAPSKYLPKPTVPPAPAGEAPAAPTVPSMPF